MTITRLSTYAIMATALFSASAALAADNAVDKLIGITRPAIRSMGKPSNPAPPPREAETPDAGEDVHFLQPDDYFIAQRPYGDRGDMKVLLAKMTTSPSAATKQQAEFMEVRNGASTWTKNFWKTRPAASGEIVMGQTILFFTGKLNHGVYLPPENKREARSGNWFITKITDTSDMFKNIVTVAGNKRIDPGNIRVIAP